MWAESLGLLTALGVSNMTLTEISKAVLDTAYLYYMETFSCHFLVSFFKFFNYIQFSSASLFPLIFLYMRSSLTNNNYFLLYIF